MGLAKAATLCLLMGLTQQSLGDDKFLANDLLIRVQSQKSVGNGTGLIGQLEFFPDIPTKYVFSGDMDTDGYSVRAGGVAEAPFRTVLALAQHLNAKGGLRRNCAEYTTIERPAFPVLIRPVIMNDVAGCDNIESRGISDIAQFDSQYAESIIGYGERGGVDSEVGANLLSSGPVLTKGRPHTQTNSNYGDYGASYGNYECRYFL